MILFQVWNKKITSDGHDVCGNSSVVERHLAKVDVAGPTPVSRSNEGDSEYSESLFFYIFILRNPAVNVTKEITRLENSAVKLTVTISKEDVAASYKESVAKIAKNIQIPGFRKGHVPISVLERKYGDALKADAASDLIEKALEEIFEENKDIRPLPYSQPAMEETPAVDVSQDMIFTVTYDVFPQVTVSGFDGITVKEAQVEVGDAELNKELEEIRERNAVVIDKKDDDPVAKDDIVTINYAELDTDGNVIESSKRQDYVFTVGTGMNLYKIDDDILGMKKTETRDIVKTYPDDFSDKDLAGKTKKLQVSVTAVKVRNLPELDDELAQDVNEKYKTLEDLKADIRKNLETAKNNRIRELKINSLLEQLVEKNEIQLPKSMISAELESRWRMAAQRMQTTPEQMEKLFASSGNSKESILKEWQQQAEKGLKSRLIVDSLMRERNITVTPEEVQAEYERIAAEAGISVEEVQKHYADPRAKEYFIDDVKEQKLYRELFEQVKIEKGDTISFEDLFKN